MPQSGPPAGGNIVPPHDDAARQSPLVLLTGLMTLTGNRRGLGAWPDGRRLAWSAAPAAYAVILAADGPAALRPGRRSGGGRGAALPRLHFRPDRAVTSGHACRRDRHGRPRILSSLPPLPCLRASGAWVAWDGSPAPRGLTPPRHSRFSSGQTERDMSLKTALLAGAFALLPRPGHRRDDGRRSLRAPRRRCHGPGPVPPSMQITNTGDADDRLVAAASDVARAGGAAYPHHGRRRDAHGRGGGRLRRDGPVRPSRSSVAECT